MNIPLRLSADQLRQAVKIKEKVEELEAELMQLLKSNGSAGPSRRGGIRIMSKAAKQRIAAAQKKRWAAWRKEHANQD